MTNLGSGGEAKASAADREAAESDLGQSAETGGLPTGGSMDTALAINAAAGATGGVTQEYSQTGAPPAAVGQNETAAYGETTTNAPAPAGNQQT